MFRPSFETLEKREVFSADLLGGLELGYQCGGSEGKPMDSFGIVPAMVGSEVAGSDREASLLSSDFNNDGHVEFQGGVTVAAGDVSGGRLTDQQPHHFYGTGVYRAIDWGDGNPLPFALADGSVRIENQILPFVEQDNVYKDSDSFRDTILDDKAFVDTLNPDVLGRVADTSAHDLVFAELEMESNFLSQSSRGIAADPHDCNTIYGVMASSTKLAINPSRSNVVDGSDLCIW